MSDFLQYWWVVYLAIGCITGFIGMIMTCPRNPMTNLDVVFVLLSAVVFSPVYPVLLAFDVVVWCLRRVQSYLAR